MKDAILALLAAHSPLSSTNIAKHLGLPDRSVTKRLQEMAVTERTLVRRRNPDCPYGSHLYALPAKDERVWYPWVEAGEYLFAQPSGSEPEDVRRLMAAEFQQGAE